MWLWVRLESASAIRFWRRWATSSFRDGADNDDAKDENRRPGDATVWGQCVSVRCPMRHRSPATPSPVSLRFQLRSCQVRHQCKTRNSFSSLSGSTKACCFMSFCHCIGRYLQTVTLELQFNRDAPKQRPSFFICLKYYRRWFSRKLL